MDNTPTDSHYIERGNAAESLLQGGIFVGAANELLNTYMAAIMQSRPEDFKERETAYAGSRAVQDIVGVLNQWVAVRDQIIANADEENND